MPPAVIDRGSRRRKARVGERAHGDAHERLFVTLFGVEHGGSADRAELEGEPGALVTDADVLGCGARDLVGCGKASQRRKHAARSTLTGEAVANTDAAWLTLNFNPQLAAGTSGGSRTHEAPRGISRADDDLLSTTSEAPRDAPASQAAPGARGTRHRRLAAVTGGAPGRRCR